MKGNNNKSHQFFPLTAIEKFIRLVPKPNRIYLYICRPLFISSVIKCFANFIYNVEYFIHVSHAAKRTKIELTDDGSSIFQFTTLIAN
jgi:hypothetical protein